MSENLKSEEWLRATVREFVEGMTYVSYYRSGKAQVTLNPSGREALVKLSALVALEQGQMLTPEEWAAAKGIVIVDPDGWREAGGPEWDALITEEEFDRRAAVSTIANRKEDGSW